MKKQQLTVDTLKSEARAFAKRESTHKEKSIFGVTDGKAVGTYLEHKFQESLNTRFDYVRGNSAKGIDFPKLGVDIKVTSIRQPQSSCPFKSAKQKIYGLGYSLLVFVYDKRDDRQSKSATLNIKHVIFVEDGRTADFQTTSGVLKIIDNAGNADDLVAFMMERFLPVDEIQAEDLAKEILSKRPEVGYLTISNALQWRLQYARVIEQAGKVNGLERLV
ncbi:MAG: restriction endonuclease [Planctomycetota bacterium]